MEKVYVVLKYVNLLVEESDSIFGDNVSDILVGTKVFKEKQKAVDFINSLCKDYETNDDFTVQGGGNGKDHLTVCDRNELYEMYFVVEEVEVE